jgi:hypothetical protein
VNNNVGKIHIYVCGEREREEQNEKVENRALFAVICELIIVHPHEILLIEMKVGLRTS